MRLAEQMERVVVVVRLGSNNTPGDGGSGVVIIRYKIVETNNPTVSSTSGASLAASDHYDMADGSTVMIFKYDASADNGQGQTDYTIDFPANVMADVLVVGGGGGGGYDRAAGGGAGGLLYL